MGRGDNSRDQVVFFDIYLFLSTQCSTAMVPVSKELIFKLPLKLNFKSIHFLGENCFKSIKSPKNACKFGKTESHGNIFESDWSQKLDTISNHHLFYLVLFPRRMLDYDVFWLYPVLEDRCTIATLRYLTLLYECAR